MTSSSLPISTPSAQGVDARALLAFLDALEAAPGVDPHSLMVLRHGHIVAEGWWAPYAADGAQLLYSLSKMFTGTALGLAVADGLLGLDDLVLDHLPELASDRTDPGVRSMRIRHVATMTAGQLDEALEAAVAADPRDWVRGFLGLRPDRQPGSVFAYSQPPTMTVAVILQRLTGQSLTEYLRPRLLDPLGIGAVAWQQDPLGREIGFSGLHTTTGAVARLGQLYLQDGVWEGRQLLPEGWVEEASRAHVSTTQRDNPDWQLGYGIQLWRSRHGYRGDGAFGQFCLVLPEQDAVVALTSQSDDMQRVLDLVWQHLLPALHAGPDAASSRTGAAPADDTLARRLAQLQRPPVQGSIRPPGGDTRWDGAELTVRPDEGGPTVRRVLLSRAAGPGGDGAWRLVLQGDGPEVAVALAPGRWLMSEPDLGDGGGPLPLGASGAWVDEHTLEVEIVVLPTPHSLRLTCRSDGSATVRWVTEPLWHRELHLMRAP